MEATKLGIKETKELIDAVLGLVGVVVAANKDGKIDLADLGLVLTLIPVVQPAIDGSKTIPAELKDLDATEAAELAAHVMGKLAIEDAKAREVIEKSLKLVAAVVELVKAIKA